MTMITEFLLSRIADDESHAWSELGSEYFTDGAWPEECAQRVLAECTAKRALVGRYEEFHATRRANWMNPNYAGAMEELGWTLQNIATVYADHPDYQPEWVL